MRTFYNEIDHYCCDWLSNLMDAGHITPGKIDDRPIQELGPDDVRGYERVHFFAGIAGWELALDLAGWSGPVWTGSCPCQPFSVAGKRKGHVDERHLWPAFHRLIAECKPATVFGEQVASKDGREWLAAVRADLEGDGYAVGAADLCAAGIGAPHIRQRLWWVAKSKRGGCEGAGLHLSERGSQQAVSGVAGAGPTGELANSMQPTSERRTGSIFRAQAPSSRARVVNGDMSDRLADGGKTGELADAAGPRRRAGRSGEARDDGAARIEPAGLRADDMGNADVTGPQGRSIDARKYAGQRSPWEASSLVWLPCSDGKARPTKPGIFPLAHGIPARVRKLRAAGNAIVPQLAAEFIKVFQ